MFFIKEDYLNYLIEVYH